MRARRVDTRCFVDAVYLMLPQRKMMRALTARYMRCRAPLCHFTLPSLMLLRCCCLLPYAAERIVVTLRYAQIYHVAAADADDTLLFRCCRCCSPFIAAAATIICCHDTRCYAYDAFAIAATITYIAGLLSRLPRHTLLIFIAAARRCYFLSMPPRFSRYAVAALRRCC